MKHTCCGRAYRGLQQSDHPRLGKFLVSFANPAKPLEANSGHQGGHHKPQGGMRMTQVSSLAWCEVTAWSVPAFRSRRAREPVHVGRHPCVLWRGLVVAQFGHAGFSTCISG